MYILECKTVVANEENLRDSENYSKVVMEGRARKNIKDL